MVWGLRFRAWGLGFNDAALSSTGFLRSTGACLTISRAWGGKSGCSRRGFRAQVDLGL